MIFQYLSALYFKTFIEKLVPNSLLKRCFNVVFWHLCLCILVKRVVISFRNFFLEEVIQAVLKISDLPAA